MCSEKIVSVLFVLEFRFTYVNFFHIFIGCGWYRFEVLKPRTILQHLNSYSLNLLELKKTVNQTVPNPGYEQNGVRYTIGFIRPFIISKGKFKKVKKSNEIGRMVLQFVCFLRR
jgi:hypothetical protein